MFWWKFRWQYCYKPRIVTVNNTAASRVKVSRGQTACDESVLCIPYIRSGRLNEEQKSSQGQTKKQLRMRL